MHTAMRQARWNRWAALATALGIGLQAIATAMSTPIQTATTRRVALDDSGLENSSAPISDKELMEAASRPFDKAKMMDQRRVLGTRNGVRIVADYPCGDLCPDYTSRHIHYDVEPGAACSAMGGVTQNEAVSIGAANAMMPFCIPPALAQSR